MIRVIDRPNIRLKDIEFQLVQDTNNSILSDFSKDIGRLPYVELGTSTIESNLILSLSLYNDQFLPRVNMKFKDSTGKLIDPLFPIDNTILKVFIQSDNDDLMPIRMDFKITQFHPTKSKSGDNNDIVFELDGILDVDNLYTSFFESYDDTSYNVLRKIASNIKLGFASNIDSTNDKMVWINPSIQYMEFIQHVVKFSFKSQETFLFAYIDFYYNLNYVDVEAILSEDIKEQQAFVGNKFTLDDVVDNNKEITDLVLLNHPDKISSNFYISSYDILNRSTATNLEIGYMYYGSYYDTEGNTIYDLALDSITTTGSDGNGIIMKGNIGEITEMTKFSSDSIYNGKIDTDNVHKYFLYAYKNNDRNLQFLQKVKMKINITTANFNLYRFQKVLVKLYKINDILNEENNSSYTEASQNQADVIQDENKLNERLSGEWLITSINYTYSSSNTFNQEIILVKRELSFNKNDFDINTKN